MRCSCGMAGVARGRTGFGNRNKEVACRNREVGLRDKKVARRDRGVMRPNREVMRRNTESGRPHRGFARRNRKLGGRNGESGHRRKTGNWRVVAVSRWRTGSDGSDSGFRCLTTVAKARNATAAGILATVERSRGREVERSRGREVERSRGMSSVEHNRIGGDGFPLRRLACQILFFAGWGRGGLRTRATRPYQVGLRCRAALTLPRPGAGEWRGRW